MPIDAPRSRRACLALLAGAGLLPMAGPARAAPAAELWPRWQATEPASTLRLDHAVLSDFLGRYRSVPADGIARLAYARVTAADRAALDAYLRRLSEAPVDRLARPEQMAFWMNLYNALTVQVVLQHYPVATIRDIDISPGLFSDGPWGKKLLTVAGEALALDDIEHRILRPIWRDPRVHYGVNCASLGCPNLPPRAFAGSDLAAMLDEAARTYVNHPRGAEAKGGRLVVSSIYHWFADDFAVDGGVVGHLRKHALPPLATALAGIDRVSDHRYDWRLNDAAA